MKIKALITAAGLGKRLGALTRSTNKSLLPVGGKPLIMHLLENLQRERVGETIVVTGYQHALVQKALREPARAVFNPFYRVSGILGSFWQARPYVDGHTFLFTTSDHFFHPSVLRDCLRAKGDIRIVVQKKKVYTKEDAKVIIKGGSIVQMGKNLPADRAHGEFGGMVRFSPRASRFFFRELEAHFQKGDLGGYMMDVLQEVSRKYRLPIGYTLCHENSRVEVDSVHDLLTARALFQRFNGSRKATTKRRRK